MIWTCQIKNASQTKVASWESKFWREVFTLPTGRVLVTFPCLTEITRDSRGAMRENLHTSQQAFDELVAIIKSHPFFVIFTLIKTFCKFIGIICIHVCNRIKDGKWSVTGNQGVCMSKLQLTNNKRECLMTMTILLYYSRKV